MAINSSGLEDEYGETEDWIEIYNSSSSSVNLQNWKLTDSPTDLDKWSFPNVTLGSNEFLVVVASGRDL
jgi:hypothetical protein